MVDLGRWINEEYRLAGKPVPSESVDTYPGPTNAYPDDHKDSPETDDL